MKKFGLEGRFAKNPLCIQTNTVHSFFFWTTFVIRYAVSAHERRSNRYESKTMSNRRENRFRQQKSQQ